MLRLSVEEPYSTPPSIRTAAGNHHHARRDPQ